MIDCREAVHRMWAYLSHALEGADVDELEEHLEICQRCCGELEFSRELRERVTAVKPEPIPGELRSRLDAILRRSGQEQGGH